MDRAQESSLGWYLMLKCTDALCLEPLALLSVSLSLQALQPKEPDEAIPRERMLAGLGLDCLAPGSASAPAPAQPAGGTGAKVTREAGPQHPPVTKGPDCYSRLQLGSGRPREVRQQVYRTAHPHGTSGSSGPLDCPRGQPGAGPWP